MFIHFEAAEKGDLIFFSWNGIVPRHIGIMISPDTYVHAPGTDNSVVRLSIVKQTPITSSLAEQIYHYNPIGFKRLSLRIGRYQRVFN